MYSCFNHTALDYAFQVRSYILPQLLGILQFLIGEFAVVSESLDNADHVMLVSVCHAM